ncbi:hypothetical protein [Virgibacillus sp. MG-45]|uniref:hypothetical protein n=1 Tax=Virgibacillus sp. MG-45 TaxID=3102791 RepID=UPI002ED81617
MDVARVGVDLDRVRVNLDRLWWILDRIGVNLDRLMHILDRVEVWDFLARLKVILALIFTLIRFCSD